jgi:hypothetical protein
MRTDLVEAAIVAYSCTETQINQAFGIMSIGCSCVFKLEHLLGATVCVCTTGDSIGGSDSMRPDIDDICIHCSIRQYRDTDIMVPFSLVIYFVIMGTIPLIGYLLIIQWWLRNT